MVEEAVARRQARRWRRLGRPFEMLSDRDFRLLWTGQLVSLLGDQLFLVALPFLLLTGRHDARRLGVVLLCLGAARAVGIVAGGGLSDRFRRRVVMMYSDLVRLVLTGLLAGVVVAGELPLVAVSLLAALLGLAQGVFLPSSYSIIPELVEDDRIVAANSMVTVQVNLSALIGPGIGGLLVAGVSPGAALAVDAATFGVSALTLALIRGRGATEVARPPGGPAAPGERDHRSFVRYVARSRLLPFCVLVTFIVNLGYAGTIEIALPALARERFAHGPVVFGVLLTGTALGALAGALSAHAVLARPRGALAALSAGALEGVSLALVPVLPGAAGSWCALVVAGAMGAVANVFFVSALQRTVPRHYLGRTMSVLMLSAAATSPVSYGVIATIVSASGAATAFGLAGAAAVAAFGVGFLSPEIRRLALTSTDGGG